MRAVRYAARIGLVGSCSLFRFAVDSLSARRVLCACCLLDVCLGLTVCRSGVDLPISYSYGARLCVFRGLGGVCSRATALDAPLFHVATTSPRSTVYLGLKVCVGTGGGLLISCVGASVGG